MAHFFSLKTTKGRWLNAQNVLLFAILLMAAFLRLYKISDYMTFLGDEGRDVLVVYNILHGKLTLLGPTSSVGGFFLGPIYYYFMAPFLWIFQYDPVGPAVMVALFGVVTVWLVYTVGSEFFNKQTGFIAAFLYAIAPIIIAYSRSSWNPNLMPFFSLLTMYTLYKAVRQKSMVLFLLCGILFGIDMQLHYVELFLGVAIAIYILFANSIYLKNWKKMLLETVTNYIVIFIGFLIGFSPFLAFELRHSFPNEKSILSFILSSGDTGGSNKFFEVTADIFFRLFGRLVTNYPPPEQIAAGMHANAAIWYNLTLLLSVVSFGIFLFRFKQTLAKKDGAFLQMLLLLVWFCVGIAIFGFYKKSIYDYYFEFMFPLPFLFVGFAIASVYANVSPKAKTAGRLIAGIILLSLVWVNLQGIPFRSLPNKQKAQVKEIADFVLSKTDNKPYNFALITGGNSDHAYRYFFKLNERDPVVIEYTGADPERKTVQEQLLVVCESLPCEPLGHPVWEIAGFGRAEIAGEWKVSVVKVYKLIHYKGK